MEKKEEVRKKNKRKNKKYSNIITLETAVRLETGRAADKEEGEK